MRVRLTGLVHDMPAHYRAMDVLALPTYREGFPNTPLEAAAMGIPVVATRVVGCVDAVVDGETGTLVPPRDASSLARALAAYLDSPDLGRRHGQAAGPCSAYARSSDPRASPAAWGPSKRQK